jgi:hypothetical protein
MMPIPELDSELVLEIEESLLEWEEEDRRGATADATDPF